MKGSLVKLVMVGILLSAMHAPGLAAGIPDQAKEQYAHAVSQKEQGNAEASLEELRQVVALAPKYEKAYTQMGITLLGLGRYEEAADSFRNAIRIRPRQAGTHRNLGYALYNLGQYEDAVKEYQEAIRIMPRVSVDAHNLLGLAYVRLDRPQDAIQAFKEAIHQRRRFAEPHFFLGLTYVSLGDKPAATAEYETLKKLNKGLAQALLNSIEDDGQMTSHTGGAAVPGNPAVGIQ